MRILKISGKNLASLAGQFSVDFESEPLASSGLFAISGPTGAGKSTLLDALCLALYDATPRLLKVAGRGSAMPDVGKETVSAHETSTLLRRGTADGYAEVDFVGNDGAAYRARWEVRRAHARAAGSLQPTRMSLHQLPSLQAVGATKTEVRQEIVRRIGLSFEQFTRAVLLAQNEFATFLKTEDNERGELLETLTGSTLYSDISMRAFERAKLEKAALQRLNDRLADQRPLGAEQRAELALQSTAADEALAVLDQRKHALEQQLRWHQEAAALAQREQAAKQAWQQGQDQLAAAAARRAALAQLDAVQGARPLADAVARIDADLNQAQALLTASQSAAGQARAAQEAAADAVRHSAAQLLEAEHGQRAAAPQLDHAKALDARIAALQPAHGQARLARAAAEQAHNAAETALSELQGRQAGLVAQQADGAAWLARHAPWQTLAQSWSRWDLLFTQAEQAAAHSAAAARALAQARGDLQRCRDDDSNARLALHASAEAVQALEAQRQQALASLGAFDSAALQGRRQALERRRDALAGAEKTWTDWSGKQSRIALLQEQTAQLLQTRQETEAALAQELAGAGPIHASLAQAERSLKSAETACADSVETLRSTLEDETPCPVCGALAHPYRHQNDALHAMLAGLQAEVALCRQQSQQHIGRLATQRAVLAANSEQQAALTQELQALGSASAAVGATWERQAAALALPAEAEPGSWFGQQITAMQHGLQAFEAEEQSLRQAGAVRDRAQQACDEAARTHAQLATAAAAAATRLAQAGAGQAALDEQNLALSARLDGLLGELDGAFRAADGENWQEHWRTAPSAFHAERLAESRQWLAQHAAQEQQALALATIEVELKAAAAVLAKARQDADAAHQAFAALEVERAAMHDARHALWDGKPVREIEAAFTDALESARSALDARQDAARLAGQALARQDEALAQATQRLAALQQAAAGAGAQLAAWLQQRQGADGVPQALGQLHALLAVAPATIDAERSALQALETQAASAATVLHERRTLCEQHQQLAPSGMAADADSLAGALDALKAERSSAQDAASALRLRIAQDDARRQDAQAILADISLQEENERRWARMNELIGSADGKKFRNYAQQFTLEVLLGYANAHLNQLARRYQLERIDNPASPSLGLMVRDQDMGGELRSVHSLSGGESFLVSLALALGLASLSSNRVRVESLFIDEGFGSLDAETLRVAMDALDGLQSLGRKVGVISHVREMTERIATRILVQPAAGGRSTVSVL